MTSYDTWRFTTPADSECPDCQGYKVVECPDCAGATDPDCDVCGGDGEISCPTCQQEEPDYE
jgi:hypothetical protein